MNFEDLATQLDGELYTDALSKTIYATDASVYQEIPDAVVIPKTEADIQRTIIFAFKNQIPLIPRSAGTSLAGQCVGKGIVIDISKHFNKIYDLDKEARTVWVEPGVIRDELNAYLKPFGLFFGPNTSTANRCMISGMIGNNSCGSSSIKYGSTRDHLLEMKTMLSDGSVAHFKALDDAELLSKMQVGNLEGSIYRGVIDTLRPEEVRSQIVSHYPHPDIKRRNTGYAIDGLMLQKPFNEKGHEFNLCHLLAGSEGTLAFTTAAKLSLDPLPPPERIVICPHFSSIEATMKAVPIIMEFQPDMCELMDKIILDCTKSNKKQELNRFFLDGDPAAILMVQFNRNTKEELEPIADRMIAALESEGLAYSYPKIYAPDDIKVFDLRAAGLGVLGNLSGDPKAVACIEDTAVRISDLPEYINEFNAMMKNFGQQAVFYAHAGAGEIHLRPILNLKKSEDVDLFHQITKSTAALVKKYKGSLSGEHGDGRVRSEFIPMMIGEENYQILQKIKNIWDPRGIFNPGKIVDAVDMKSSLRYIPDEVIDHPKTMFSFQSDGGIIRSAEKCNGSGDCRKLDFSGGTMCPSYRATRNEKDSTRARANALRNYLSHPKDSSKPFNSKEVKEVLDLCLSCKACGTECPSSVDMSTMKSEFEYQYQKINGTTLRSSFFANFVQNNRLAVRFYPVSKWFLSNSFFAYLLKKSLGIAKKRSLPLPNKKTLYHYYKHNFNPLKQGFIKEVYLFCDEFTNYLDLPAGIATIELLTRLNYKVTMLDHPESGRAAFSKGFLERAKECANGNVSIFASLISKETPLIGVEPSAILSFRDEYPRIVDASLMEKALRIQQYTYLLEEFIMNEVKAGNIREDQFDNVARTIAIHGHCHQKALSSIDFTCQMLSLPKNHLIENIPSGCCGMAGSFGYEAEHYDISMKIGGSVLFPYLEKIKPEVIVAASGTSCRHQIADGTGKKALHPAEILLLSLKKEI